MRARSIVSVVIFSLLLATSTLGVAQPAAASGINQATFVTRWWDCCGLELNEVRNAVAISYDDSNYVTYANCRDSRWWRTETGWQETFHDLACNNDGSSGDSATANTFYNQPFCGGTWTDYQRNHAYATPYGASGWVDNTYATGCLSWSFSYDQIFWPGQYF